MSTSKTSTISIPVEVITGETSTAPMTHAEIVNAAAILDAARNSHRIGDTRTLATGGRDPVVGGRWFVCDRSGLISTDHSTEPPDMREPI